MTNAGDVKVHAEQSECHCVVVFASFQDSCTNGLSMLSYSWRFACKLVLVGFLTACIMGLPCVTASCVVGLADLLSVTARYGASMWQHALPELGSALFATPLRIFAFLGFSVSIWLFARFGSSI